MADGEPTTEELRVAQRKREDAERERAGRAISEDDTEQHERRADKAAYLREKLEERAESERQAEREDE
jgi:hypothetical protein